MVLSDDEREAGAGTTVRSMPSNPGDEAERTAAEELLEDAPRLATVPCEYLCGPAGSGKTFEIKRRIAEDLSYGILSASTGIAGVNLDAVTINALLGYFDTPSLKDLYVGAGNRLVSRLHQLALAYRWLIIDEVSMIDAAQLDLIYYALTQANGYRDVKQPMGILLIGDFLQLPPVEARFAFEAECWEHFDVNTTRLTSMWRQSQPVFLDALAAARRGDGAVSADLLSSAGLEWRSQLDLDYSGTMLVSKNSQVDRVNQTRLGEHRGKRISLPSRRWGFQMPAWKNNIPPTLELKQGCYVMLLSNSRSKKRDDGDPSPDDGKFSWVNGDCGTVMGHQDGLLRVQLVRTGGIVEVPAIVRNFTVREKPFNWYNEDSEEKGGYVPEPHLDAKKNYVTGQIEYYPARLAYASTVHKCQGLSLDRCQIDIRDSFFAQPGMEYVAISRVRTLDGLRIVGQQERFARNCNTDPRVRRFL